jgi:AcrR family transcriptional regulator
MRTKTAERELAILAAAAAVFSELGIEKATMSDIVRRIGGSKSTIYSYFPTKELLVAAVLEHASEQLLQQAFHKLDADTPAALVLASFGQVYLHCLLQPEMLGMLRIAQQHGGTLQDGSDSFYERGPLVGWSLMAEHIRQRMSRGELRSADPWVTAMHLKGLLQAEHLDRAMFGYPVPSAQKIGEAALLAVDVFLRAYAAKQTRAAPT